MVSFHFNGCWRKCICYSLVLLFNLWREVKCILLKITRSTRSNFLWRVEVRSSGYSELDDTSSSLLPSVLVYQVGCNMLYPSYTLQGTDISQLGNRKIIFKSTSERGYVSFQEGMGYGLLSQPQPISRIIQVGFEVIQQHAGWTFARFPIGSKSVMLDFPLLNTRHDSTIY